MSETTMKITRINPNIGAEVSGLDLTRPVSDSDFKTLFDAWVEHEVLVFPDQDITVDHQMAFAACFGELSIHPFSPNMDDKPEVIVLDNHRDNPPALTDVWHSDETFRFDPPAGTMLRAKVVPEVGGDTMFCSMTAAFEGLSDRLQHFITGLEAVHDFKPFRTLFGDSPEDRASLRRIEDTYPNPTHPVVRLHPVSGKPILNVNPQFTLRIVGMKERESRMLLDLLFGQAQIPDYQLRVRWKPNTMTFWDNRATQHYAIHDYWPQRRLMERVTIKGDRPVGPEDVMAGIKGPFQKRHGSRGLKAASGQVPKRQFQRAY